MWFNVIYSRRGGGEERRREGGGQERREGEVAMEFNIDKLCVCDKLQPMQAIREHTRTKVRSPL